MAQARRRSADAGLRSAIAVGASLPATFPIDRYQDALPSITVLVNGAARTFLLDTGAGITCITPEVAEDVGATPFGRLVGLRMSGASVELRRCDGVSLRVGEHTLAPPTVGVIDLAALLPEGWPPVDGVLGLDAFVEQPLTIDLPARVLTLESLESLVARQGSGIDVRIRVARPVQGFAREVFVAADFGGRTLWLELDSGNTGPVLLGAHVGLEEDSEITLDLGRTAWTGACSRQALILDGNLGQSFFAGGAITLDLASERMTLAAVS